MKRFTSLIAPLLLLACATPPPAPTLQPPPPTTPQTADARTRAELHTQLGACYFELRNFSVALEELNEAIRADSDYGPAHNMLGLVYMELREDALAEQSFERALQINASDSDAHNNYGWFLCQRKRYDPALKHFMAAVRNPLYPTPDKSYVNAGICMRERGDDAAAAELFERALSLQPGQPQALYQLADIAFKRGQAATSKEYLTRLSRAGIPLGADVLWLALRVERSLGDRDAEASYGLQLRRNYPNSPQTQALLNRQYE